jgi:hypothetical protein
MRFALGLALRRSLPLDVQDVILNERGSHQVQGSWGGVDGSGGNATQRALAEPWGNGRYRFSGVRAFGLPPWGRLAPRV